MVCYKKIKTERNGEKKSAMPYSLRRKQIAGKWEGGQCRFFFWCNRGRWKEKSNFFSSQWISFSSFFIEIPLQDDNH